MAAAWKATFRSPRRPSRALGCHNADFFRRGWRVGTVQRPRMLTAFCWKAQDQRNRRGTTGYFTRAHSALCSMLHGLRGPSDQREKQEVSDPAPLEGRVAALVQF